MADGKLRVLMVGPFPDDAERVVGGVESATLTLAHALAAHPAIDKIIVASIHTGHREFTRLTIGPKLEVRFIRVPFINGDALVRCLPAVWAIRKLVGEFRPHIAHGQGIGRMGEIAVQLGLPAVVTIHGLIHIEARVTERRFTSRLKEKALEACVRRVLGRAAVVISISDYDARELTPLIKGKRVNIPNAISNAFFEASGIPPQNNTIFFGGLIRARKNVLGLIGAFTEVRKALPDARLVIAGPTYDEAYRQKLVERIATDDLDRSVNFIGHVEFDRLVAEMRGASLVSLFSNEETLPTVIAQAMAMGRPVVASNVGGIGDMVIEGVTGHMVAPNDEAALAARMLDVLSSPNMSRAMGSQAAAIAQTRWRASAIADQTVAAYQLALGTSVT